MVSLIKVTSDHIKSKPILQVKNRNPTFPTKYTD